MVLEVPKNKTDRFGVCKASRNSCSDRMLDMRLKARIPCIEQQTNALAFHTSYLACLRVRGDVQVLTSVEQDKVSVFFDEHVYKSQFG